MPRRPRTDGIQSPQPSTPGTTAESGSASVGPQTERIDSESLLQGRRQIELLHQGEVYRLQVTRLGKLILTK